MALDDKTWIKLNLPARATFNKNGVALTIDQACDEALILYPQKEKALSELLNWLAANETKETESLGDYSYSGPKTKEMADNWDGIANTGAGSNSFGFVPMKTQATPTTTDEFSAT